MSKHPRTVFGRRLREARERKSLPQDKLGVLIGLDEGCASARISRYETGIHEPPFPVAEKIAKILEIPVAYMYCVEEDLAAALVAFSNVPQSKRGAAIAEVLDVIGRYVEIKR